MEERESVDTKMSTDWEKKLADFVEEMQEVLGGQGVGVRERMRHVKADGAYLQH